MKLLSEYYFFFLSFCLNRDYSKTINLELPQGSVLGPILFILYINDLPEVVSSSMKIFADDTKLYNKDSNSDIIQQDLDALCTWAKMAVAF